MPPKTSQQMLDEDFGAVAPAVKPKTSQAMLDEDFGPAKPAASSRAMLDEDFGAPKPSVAPPGGYDRELRALAQQFGLTVTSAQRSRAKQARVNPGSPNSYHTSGDWNRAGALDLGGDHGKMRQFYAEVRKRYPDLAESFLNLPNEWDAYKRGQKLGKNPEGGRAPHIHLAWDRPALEQAGPPRVVVPKGKKTAPPVLPPNLGTIDFLGMLRAKPDAGGVRQNPTSDVPPATRLPQSSRTPQPFNPYAGLTPEAVSQQAKRVPVAESAIKPPPLTGKQPPKAPAPSAQEQRISGGKVYDWRYGRTIQPRGPFLDVFGTREESDQQAQVFRDLQRAGRVPLSPVVESQAQADQLQQLRVLASEFANQGRQNILTPTPGAALNASQTVANAEKWKDLPAWLEGRGVKLTPYQRQALPSLVAWNIIEDQGARAVTDRAALEGGLAVVDVLTGILTAGQGPLARRALRGGGIAGLSGAGQQVVRDLPENLTPQQRLERVLMAGATSGLLGAAPEFLTPGNTAPVVRPRLDVVPDLPQNRLTVPLRPQMEAPTPRVLPQPEAAPLSPVARGGAFQTEVQAPRTAPEFGGVQKVPQPPKPTNAPKPWVWEPRRGIRLDTRYDLGSLDQVKGTFTGNPLQDDATSFVLLGEIIKDPIWRKELGDLLETPITLNPALGPRNVARAAIPQDGGGRPWIEVNPQRLGDRDKLAYVLLHEAGHLKRNLKGRPLENSADLTRAQYRQSPIEASASKFADYLWARGSDKAVNRPHLAVPTPKPPTPAPAQVLDDIATGRYQSTAPNLPTQPVQVTRRPTVAPATPAEAPVQAPAPTRQVARQVEPTPPTAAATPPVKPEAPPKPTPAPREATGLANQVQEREALAGIIRDPEKGLSRDAAFFQRRGKELVEQGQADPDAVAREIANGKGINADDFGVMLEGKRRKTLAVNAARKKLDLAIAGKSDDVPRLRAEYEAAQADLQGFLDNVQKGKTEWSNIGRSLQAGTEINTGDFAEVLAEARRVKGGAVDAATEQRLKELTEDIAKRDAQIAELEATAKRLEAEGVAQSVRPDQPAPQIVKPGYRVTFTGEIRLADGTRVSAGDAADLVRLARAAKQGAEAVKALQDEWGADRLGELSKLGQKLKGTDALQVRAQWERARAEWEDGQLSAEWADQRRQDALETLRRLLASSTKKSDSYFAEALDAKGRPVRKQAKYREFSRTDATEDERREILRLVLDANPSLEGKEWTIPGFGKGGLESLIVDAGIIPEEVANRYSLKPGLGGRKGPRLQPSLEGHASEPKTIAPKRVAIRQEREKILADLDALLKDAGKINDLGSATYDAARFGYVAGKLALNYMKEGVAVLDEVVEQVIADLKARGLSVTREQVIDDLMEVSKPAKPRTRNEATARLAALKREARELAKVQGQVRQLEAGTALPQGPKPPQASAGGMLGELRAKRDALLKGRRQEAAAAAGAPRKERLEADRLARVQAEIKSLEAQLAGGTADPKVGPPKLRQVSQRLEEARALRDLNKRRVEALIRAQKPKTALDVAGEVANTVRGTTLGSDIGVLTRQGLFSWSRPLTAAKATGRAVRAAFSETELALFERELETRRVGGKLALLERKRAGLQITDRLSNPEELVVAQLLKKIPGVRALFGDRLERFQTTFINAVRADLFDQALAAGFTPEELKLRANFINSATGRGNVRNVPKLLSVIMTSPRYEASRWEMLAQPLRNAAALGKDAATGKGLNRAALANLRDMSVTAAGIFGLFKAAELGGYSVDWNPESSDFLKMRRGEEVWDPSAGLSVRLRDVLRLYVSSTHPGHKRTTGDVLMKTGLRTISPAVRLPYERGSVAYQRSQGVQQPKSPLTGYQDETERKGLLILAPLIVQSFTEALQKEGPGAAAWAGAREFVGQSVGRYPRSKNAPPPSKAPRLKDLLGK
jgi:hypothetical protein